MKFYYIQECKAKPTYELYLYDGSDRHGDVPATLFVFPDICWVQWTGQAARGVVHAPAAPAS